MTTSPSSLFRKSLLAAAVLAASGCASTAPDRSNGGFGDTLAQAGRATADLTSRAWHRTGYLLGLHDDGNGDEFAAPPLDAVDLAMLEEDAVMPEPATNVTLAAADVDSAIAQPSDTLAVARFVAPAQDAAPEPMAALDVMQAPTQEALPTEVEPALLTVSADDYIHVVGEQETLWDIAKLTTGDATNWHVLADLNDLAPNAAVFPGQDLTIPADMVKPELAAGEPLPAAPVDAPTTLVADAADSAPQASERLAVPVKVASAPSPVAPAAEQPADDASGFRIQDGETLWDFAKRTTGDATYWQAIAAHNGFDEKRAVTVRAGEQIFVPEALVRPELSETVVAAAPSEPEPRMVPIAEASAALPAEPGLPADATVALNQPLADQPTILDETRDIRIVEAAYRAEQSSTAPDAAPAADMPSEIMISGTYYPKAVYNDADFSSSLLMRVSPGTTLRVASVDGPWYAVETEDGVGYVHDRDIK